MDLRHGDKFYENSTRAQAQKYLSTKQRFYKSSYKYGYQRKYNVSCTIYDWLVEQYCLLIRNCFAPIKKWFFFSCFLFLQLECIKDFLLYWCKGSAVSIFRSNLIDYYNIYNYITDIQILVIWLVELTSRDIHYYSNPHRRWKRPIHPWEIAFPIQQLGSSLFPMFLSSTAPPRRC